MALYAIILIATIITALAIEVAFSEFDVGYALVMGIATGLAADIAHAIATNRQTGTTQTQTQNRT